MRRISLNQRRWLVGRVALVSVALIVYFVSGGGLVYTVVGTGILLLLFLVGPRLFTWTRDDQD